MTVNTWMDAVGNAVVDAVINAVVDAILDVILILDAILDTILDAVAIAWDHGAAAFPCPIPQTFARKRLPCL
ncbi:MAG TPA: hypothetical protein V6C88_11840 [Chroococcidiopsis sp.]